MALETYLHLKQRGCFERYRPEVWVGQVVGPAPFSDWSVLALVIKHGRKMVIMHDTGRLNYRSGPAIKEDICQGNYRIRISPPPNHREPSLLNVGLPDGQPAVAAESWKSDPGRKLKVGKSAVAVAGSVPHQTTGWEAAQSLTLTLEKFRNQKLQDLLWLCIAWSGFSAELTGFIYL